MTPIADPVVRALDDSDVEPLASLLAELPLLQRYGRTDALLTADLRAARARGEGLLVLVEDGLPSGLAWFTSRGAFGIGAYLRLLAVAPRAHGRGHGARLLAAFEHAAAAAESRHAMALVSDFNTNAQRFYEREGYARSGAFPGLVLADVTELLYWKRLR